MIRNARGCFLAGGLLAVLGLATLAIQPAPATSLFSVPVSFPGSTRLGYGSRISSIAFFGLVNRGSDTIVRVSRGSRDVIYTLKEGGDALDHDILAYEDAESRTVYFIHASEVIGRYDGSAQLFWNINGECSDAEGLPCSISPTSVPSHVPEPGWKLLFRLEQPGYRD